MPRPLRRLSVAVPVLAAAALAGGLVATPPDVAAQEASAHEPSGRRASAWCPQPEARQFDFWLGEWDVANRNRPPDGDTWYDTGAATDRVYPVVGGCAVVEHWRGRAFPSAGHIAGFSVRAWDAGEGHWTLVLLWPLGGPPRFGELHGTFRHGRGEFFDRTVNPRGDSVVTRLTFSDITGDSFRWHNDTSSDGGRTWASTWIMEFTRRPILATGLLNGPTTRTARCPGEEHRALDALLGEWSGRRTTAEGDSAGVTVEVVRILDGCAVMERETASDGSWEAFRVRAYEPDRGGWTEFASDADRPRLVRRHGGPGGDGFAFADDAVPGAGVRRTRWTPLPDGGWRVVHERAPGPGGPWTPAAETRLLARVPPGG